MNAVTSPIFVEQWTSVARHLRQRQVSRGVSFGEAPFLMTLDFTLAFSNFPNLCNLQAFRMQYFERLHLSGMLDLKEMCPLRQHVLATSQSLKMRCSSSPLTGCQPFLLVRRMVPQRIVLVHRLAAAVVSDGTGYRRDPRQVQLVLCNGRASPTIN